MRYFQVRYDSSVVIYERKLFIRLATGEHLHLGQCFKSQADSNVNFMGREALTYFIKGIITVWLTSSLTRKNRQMSIKVAKYDFARKMKDFDTFTKIA